ncbi:MAG: protein translocase subunit SecD [Nocardioidaceae bacterium]
MVIAALYGAVALGGNWAPKLGLDLQGGTLITLQASTENGGAPPADKLEEARGIIDQRVNGSGVTESQVSTQGNNNIVVEIPGQNRKNLVDTVSRTAQLRFRLVACASNQPTPACAPYLAQAQSSATPSTAPSSGPSSAPSSSPGAKSSPKAGSKATPKGRAISGGLINADKKPGSKPSKTAAAKPSPSPAPSATPLPSAVPTPTTTSKGAPVNQPLKWQDDPGTTWLKKWAAYKCPTKGQLNNGKVNDIVNQPLVTCDDQGVKYLLSATSIPGTDLTSASAGIPQNQVAWVVNLSLNSAGRTTFAKLSQALAGTQKQFAIVLDGRVISAPVFNGVIPNGQAEISGNFNQQSAQSLANSLKYGALPLKFTVPVVTEEGPTLAADQLTAGLTAGAIGLALVLIYCMFYYRGLGIVVLASLAIAAAITYAVVLVMSQAVGFTLTLPGIAGLIVAVGITADSFIVYFERIRDEMRDGKSMRVAVEAGWTRARNTCLAADAVSLLAALVLYIFSIGVVKGFAFALGISTLIDLVVFFMFTKPMVSWLATFRFFSSGHKMSGLSPDHVGRKRAVGQRPSAAGGNA